jgi:hypothetical protein
LPPLQRPTAADWFRQQPEAVQREMMGKQAFDLYRDGKIRLDDFIGEARSAKWGPMAYQRSLRRIEAEIDAPTWLLP